MFEQQFHAGKEKQGRYFQIYLQHRCYLQSHPWAICWRRVLKPAFSRASPFGQLEGRQNARYLYFIFSYIWIFNFAIFVFYILHICVLYFIIFVFNILLYLYFVFCYICILYFARVESSPANGSWLIRARISGRFPTLLLLNQVPDHDHHLGLGHSESMLLTHGHGYGHPGPWSGQSPLLLSSRSWLWSLSASSSSTPTWSSSTSP